MQTALALLCTVALPAAAQDNRGLHWVRVRLARPMSYPDCRIVDSHGELERQLAAHFKPDFPDIDWKDNRVLVITPGNITPYHADLEGGVVHVRADPSDNDTGAVIIVVPPTYQQASSCSLDRTDEQSTSFSWTFSLDTAGDDQNARPVPDDEHHRVAPDPGLEPQ